MAQHSTGPDKSPHICIWDYHVSKQTGFLVEDPLEHLPDYFEPWNRLVKSAPELVSRHEIRRAVRDMPLLDHTRLHGHRQKRLAHLQLTLIASQYIWQEGDDGVTDHLPECLAVPLWHVSTDLGLKPIVSHAGIVLANWKYISDKRDTDCFYISPGGDACRWFFKVTVDVEMAFAHCLPHLQKTLDGVVDKDKAKVTEGLANVANAITEMLDNLKKMHERLTADAFYNVVRPYLGGWGGVGSPLPDGLIFEGISDIPVKMSGGSAAQSTTLQLLDALLGVTHSADQRRFLDEMRNYMPPSHKQLVEDVESLPHKLSHFVADTAENTLTDAYNKCIGALLTLRNYHIQMVTKYVVIASKKKARENNYKSLATKGTGGTDLLPFLKEIRDDTKCKMT